ncbi:hypothetical protein GDO78_019929 [Eleutherodactylus coqui]|uniref:Uncharacterized protein n=1 Tax=Eleutherodactylus coqui TaxID=57060 RepID=A0A8J6EI16_ELECQ|nr:hypothetical protein GDO78_019929 [Eleutherodactylus coqui]
MSYQWCDVASAIADPILTILPAITVVLTICVAKDLLSNLICCCTSSVSSNNFLNLVKFRSQFDTFKGSGCQLTATVLSRSGNNTKVSFSQTSADTFRKHPENGTTIPGTTG